VLERLAASSDRPARALTMLGRLVKTIHILRYLQDAAIRDRVQLQLNRGESRHELARRLFFANQGAFRTGDYEEIMNKVSALAVLSNAVLVWNTRRRRLADQGDGEMFALAARARRVDQPQLRRTRPAAVRG
jgi:TnpA family transposase